MLVRQHPGAQSTRAGHDKHLGDYLQKTLNIS
jgi:hypothetical protein